MTFFEKKLENLCCNSKDFEGCGYPRKIVLVSFWRDLAEEQYFGFKNMIGAV